MHFFKICSARQYFVASVKRIETETIASAELQPSAGHELHQAHRASRRDRVRLACAFDLAARSQGLLLSEVGTNAFTLFGRKMQQPFPMREEE